MSPEGTPFETIEEFLDSLPEVPCSSKLGEPFCSLCERVNRKVARACRYSRIFSGEGVTPSLPPETEAEKEDEGAEEVVEDLRIMKIVKEKGLPEIEIVPPGGVAMEMKVEEGEMVFRKAGEAEIRFAELKRRAQEEIVGVQRLLGHMKELGYGLENLKDEIRKMAEDFRQKEYERVIERAERLRRVVLEEENMKTLKESLEALVEMLSQQGKAGGAGEFLKVATECYGKGDYGGFIENSVKVMKEIERASGSRIVIGFPLEMKEEETEEKTEKKKEVEKDVATPMPVKKVVKKVIEPQQKPPGVPPEATAGKTPHPGEGTVKTERPRAGEGSGRSSTPAKKKTAKKVIKKTPREKDRISEIVTEAYSLVEAKRGEGKDVSQILELLAMVDQKRREGQEEFAEKLATQSLEMAKRL